MVLYEDIMVLHMLHLAVLDGLPVMALHITFGTVRWPIYNGTTHYIWHCYLPLMALHIAFGSITCTTHNGTTHVAFGSVRGLPIMAPHMLHLAVLDGLSIRVLHTAFGS